MLLIVGNSGGTNVGESLMKAAAELGHEARLARSVEAMSQWRFPQAFMWHLAGRRPFHLDSFSKRVVDNCRRLGVRTLISTGSAPITAGALQQIGAMGTRRLNYSTDDPWNPVHRAPWFLKSLPHYDTIFTPRRANIEDFARLGCRSVHYLPFGYDPRHFSPDADQGDSIASSQVVFVGGADDDRAAFFRDLIRHGVQPLLVGDYWSRYAGLAPLSLGHKTAEELGRMTLEAAVNLCLVRRGNRDGHVMRSFEIPAVGGFIIAEDTAEHRALFGAEGQAVLYFVSPEEAAEKCRWALANPSERRGMAAAAHALVTNGEHTYRDRLKTMLQAASSL